MTKTETDLSFVASKVIESLRETGLDANYLDEKIYEFSELSNYASLHRALRILDDKNTARLAEKLGASVDDLSATLRVLNKI